MGSIVRGKILRDDLALWDGKNATSTRVDATSGTITGLQLNDYVDVLQVYGSGTAQTVGSLSSAVAHIGSNKCKLMLTPGTWTIDTAITVPSNFTVYIADGVIFNVSASITVTFSGPVEIAPKAEIAIGTSGSVVFSVAPSIPHMETIFTGAGTVTFSSPQIVVPDWWDRTATTCIQKAIDATAQGSAIHLVGKYTTTGIEINSDEANQTGDIGKSLVGIAAPGLRLNDKTSGSWGAEIYLADSSDDDVIDFNGTAQGSEGSRFSFRLVNLKINGNKANQGAGAWNGVRINFLKDLWFENVYIEDCKQDGIDAGNGSSNQVHFGYVEVYNCDRDGIRVGSLGDFSGGTVKTATNGRYGFNWAVGHGHIDHIHTYLNTDDGLRYTVAVNNGRASINYLRTAFNGHIGLFVSGDNMHIDRLVTEHNGTDTGESNANRVGLYLAGGAQANYFGLIDAYDPEGTATQTYHLFSVSTGKDNRIKALQLDANATVGDIYIDATARNSLRMETGRVQTSSTTTGNQEINPQLGDLVLDTALTGALDLDYTVGTKVPNGFRQKITIEDGGGQNITAGTFVTAIATLPTPATNAKRVILQLEYYAGKAHVVEAYQEA